jgi:hypothetical protein
MQLPKIIWIILWVTFPDFTFGQSVEDLLHRGLECKRKNNMFRMWIRFYAK